MDDGPPFESGLSRKLLATFLIPPARLGQVRRGRREAVGFLSCSIQPVMTKFIAINIGDER
jgi:hypothetical protein